MMCGRLNWSGCMILLGSVGGWTRGLVRLHCSLMGPSILLVLDPSCSASCAIINTKVRRRAAVSLVNENRTASRVSCHMCVS